MGTPPPLSLPLLTRSPLSHASLSSTPMASSTATPSPPPPPPPSPGTAPRPPRRAAFLPPSGRALRGSPAGLPRCPVPSRLRRHRRSRKAAAGMGGGESWVPVVPLEALPRGERRVIMQDGDTILLLWYKDEVYAVENRSPAEGAYSEGLLNAKLTQDGCIVCPTTDSTFDLRTGEIKEWYPNNPVLRVLTPPLRKLFVYPVKTDAENIYISVGGAIRSGGSAEIIFSGKAQPGVTASDVNVEEVRMVVDDDVGGFGFTNENELINGKAAIIGFLFLIDFELITGKGLLKGTGFLDFIYAVSKALSQ